MTLREILTHNSFLINLRWSLLGIAIALVIDFGFYIFAGRLLGPEAFGFFGVFIAIYYLAVGPFYNTIEIASKKISAEGDNSISLLAKPALKTGFLIWILFLISSPVLQTAFSLPLTSIIVFSFIFPLVYLLAVLSGTVQGLEKFHIYAYYEILSSLAKFCGLGLIVLIGLTGAVAAPVLETVVGILVIIALIKPSISFEEFKNRLILQKSFIVITAVYAAFSIDILLLKYFMDVKTVGLYHAVGTIGKSVFFGSAAINRAVFPRFVKNSDQRFKLFHLALFLIICGGFLATILLVLFGTEVLTFTFGSEYYAAAEFAPLYIIFITLVSGVSLIGNYHLSTESPWTKRILIFPIFQTLGILLFHETVSQILYVSIGAALATFVVLYLPAFKNDIKTILIS